MNTTQRTRSPRAVTHRKPDHQLLAAVAIGGAIGASLRYAFNIAFPTDPGAFPLTTLCENAAGAMALGFALMVITNALRSARYLQALLCTGVLGSFTTFSTFSIETVGLIEADRVPLAMGYLWGSMMAGLTAGVLGMAAGRWVGRRLPRSREAEG